MIRVIKRTSLFLAVLAMSVSMISGACPTAVTCAADTNKGNLSNASPLSAGKSITGSTPDKDTSRCYKFTAQSAGFLSFYIERDKPQSTTVPVWKATVYNTDGNQISTVSETSFHTQAVMVDKGDVTYVLIANGGSDTSEKFRLTAEFTEYENVVCEPANTATDAVAVALGETYLGVMDSSNDEDYIKLTTDESGVLKMSLTKYVSSISSQANWGFTLYDSSLNEMYKLTTTYETDSLNTEGLYLVIPAHKTYFVKISGSSYTPGILYSFTTSFSKSSLVETEPNNSFANADKLKLKKTYRGTLAETTTGDYYSFKAKKSGKHTVNITLSNEIANSYKVSVYDADRNLIDKKDNVFKKGKISFKAKKGKKYYVVLEHVSGFNSSKNAYYKLKVAF